MPENKTQPTTASVEAFIQAILEPRKREDSQTLLALMQEVTGLAPVMWGESMVGFGKVHYKYASGREGDYFMVGFSPRKQNLTVYFMDGFERHAANLARLGKHKTSVSCLYLNKLADIDLNVLREMLATSVQAQTV
jgi:hypothetical protein